jgi:hypothetical protein
MRFRAACRWHCHLRVANPFHICGIRRTRHARFVGVRGNGIQRQAGSATGNGLKPHDWHAGVIELAKATAKV